MAQEHTAIHLLAGGMGGTAGAVITCPLEVVKTRLQSSVASFNGQRGVDCTPRVYHSPITPARVTRANYTTCTTVCSNTVTQSSSRTSAGLLICLRHIVETEGTTALFKGLGPTLVGVAPSRAIYFYSYARSKSYFNNVFYPDTPIVHVCSAACAGFTASTTTNPIWFIKTRLQLDQKRNNRLTVIQCIRDVYRSHGIKGFYKGVTASYYGISETVIHFVIYEAIKAKLRESKVDNGDDIQQRGLLDFFEFMGAGAMSKTCATCVAYPHEVARTRLRQEGSHYRTFWQTLSVVFHEEGVRGLYRGLTTQLVRQIPNTAVMMATYEAVVYLCTKGG